MGVKFYGAPGAADKIKEEGSGQSYMKIFRRSSANSVLIKFINPDPMIFRFSRMIELVPGDTVDLICRTIAKDYEDLDPKTIKLYRYEDLMDERRIPEFGQPLKGKVLIPADATFEVDDADKVFVVSNGSKHHIGGTVSYLTY